MRALKTLLWLCLLMVGLQCCMTSAVHAAGLQPADELSLRAEDPAAPEAEVGLGLELELLRSELTAWQQPGSGACVNVGTVDERSALRSAVFTVGGVQPSAP